MWDCWIILEVIFNFYSITFRHSLEPPLDVEQEAACVQCDGGFLPDMILLTQVTTIGEPD